MASQKYLDWIVSGDAERVLLCEVEVWNVSTQKVETFYLSTLSANDYQHYLPLITKTPIIMRSINLDLKSSLTMAAGFIEVNLDGGRLDPLIYYAFRGRNIQFKHGDASWNVDEFETIYTGTVSDFEVVSDTTIRMDFTNGDGLLDVVINPRVMTSAEAPSAAGAFAPLCFGHCRNIVPVLIDDSGRKYKVHDGEIENIINVYADGNAAGSGNWSENLADGTFTLLNNTNDSKRITCTVRGASNTTGGYYELIGEIVEQILTEYGEHLDETDPDNPVMVKGHLPISRIDLDSITTFDLGSPIVGFYADEKGVNLLLALQSIVGSHIGWYDFNRDGIFRLNELAFFQTDTLLENGEWVAQLTATPDVGFYTFDETDIAINNIDDLGADHSSFMVTMKEYSHIFVQEQVDDTRWVDYRVVTNIDNGSYHLFECTVFDQGAQPLRKGRAANIRLTQFDSTLEQKPITVSIDDANIIGDLHVSHYDARPVIESTVGYQKNWAGKIVRSGTGTIAAESHAYKYKTVAADNAAEIGIQYADAGVAPPILTLLQDAGEATIQAELRQILNGKQYYQVMPKTYLVGFAVELGDIAEITSSRFKLDHQRFTIMHIEEDMLNSTSTIGGIFYYGG